MSPKKLFSGTACFSPTIAGVTMHYWAAHGGTIARSEQERRNAQFYFCSSIEDPWVKRLSAKSLVVFDAAWIRQSVKEQFCVSIARYVLDESTKSRGCVLPSQISRRLREGGGAPDLGTHTHTRKRRVDELESPEPPNRPSKRTRIQDGDVIEESRDAGQKPVEGEALPGRSVPDKVVPTKRAEEPIKHLDLVAELARIKQKRRFQISAPPLSATLSEPVPRSNATVVECEQRGSPPTSLQPPDLLKYLYEHTPMFEPQSCRYSVATVLGALGDLSTIDTCVFEAGRHHLGKEFHTLSLRRSPGHSHI